MHLKNLKEGEAGVIKRFQNDELAISLMAMGVLPGKRIEVVRKTAGGHTFYVKIEQLQLAIRKKEAECIVVK